MKDALKDNRKDPGFAKLGADLAAELENTVVPRILGEREVTSRTTSRDTSSIAPGTGPVGRIRRIRRLRRGAARALVAIAVAAAFAVGVSVPRRAPTSTDGASSAASGDDGRAFTYDVTTPGGDRASMTSDAGNGTGIAGSPSAARTPALGEPLSWNGEDVAVRFSDGSRVAVEPRSLARVVSTEAHGATVLLERGRLAASIVHREHTAWKFFAGPYVVHVTGTAFDLAWDPKRSLLALHMTEGAVVVSGCGEKTWSVRGGGELKVACDDRGASSSEETALAAPENTRDAAGSSGSAASATSLASLPSLPSMPSVPSVPSTATSPLASPAPRPTSSASASMTPGTSASARAPEPASPLETMDAPALWQLAQGARGANDTKGAKTALLVYRRRFASDPRASVAAFQLGALACDAEDARAEGLGWFTTYLAEAPDGPLAREAEGRALETSVLLHKKDDSAKLARAYLDKYRGGPHADLATRVLEGKAP